MTRIWAGPAVCWAYLVCVIDCCTREIVGGLRSHRCGTEDALVAVEQAVLPLVARFAPGWIKNGVDPDAVDGAANQPYEFGAIEVDWARQEPPSGIGTSGWCGRGVTREALEQVERGEDALRALGFRQFRLRHHGAVARVEIAREEMERALSLEMLGRMSEAIKACGFKFVALDVDGFRSGSMNAMLAVEKLR